MWGGGGLASFHQAGDIRNVRNCLGRKVPINWCINSYCFQEIIAVHAEQVDKKEIKNHLRITYIYIYILQLSYLTEIQFVWAKTKCVLNYWFRGQFLKETVSREQWKMGLNKMKPDSTTKKLR